jgi:hypothetical protein
MRTPDTQVQKVADAVALVKQARPDLKVEGPLQYDAAIDPAVAAVKIKTPSEVAGKASVFIFPDLNTGNNTYKAVQQVRRVCRRACACACACARVMVGRFAVRRHGRTLVHIGAARDTLCAWHGAHTASVHAACRPPARSRWGP